MILYLIHETTTPPFARGLNKAVNIKEKRYTKVQIHFIVVILFSFIFIGQCYLWKLLYSNLVIEQERWKRKGEVGRSEHDGISPFSRATQSYCGLRRNLLKHMTRSVYLHIYRKLLLLQCLIFYEFYFL